MKRVPSSASFLLSHFTLAPDNHVNQPSMKLMPNMWGCGGTMGIKKETEIINRMGKDSSLATVWKQRDVGQLCLLVICKKERERGGGGIIPRVLTYSISFEKCLPERDRYAPENGSNLFHVR